MKVIKQTFHEMFDALVRQWYPTSDRDIAGFWSLTGSRWSGELMVVGRFVNGWTVHSPWKELVDPVSRAVFLEEIVADKEFHEAPCPVKAFTDKLKNNRSQFWCAVRDIAKELGIGSDWASQIVYSNLYRVGPDGGNPPASLRRAQFEYCRKLLAHEISARDPKRVVMMTGWNWARSFFAEGGIPFEPLANHPWQYVESVGNVSLGTTRVRVVISKHPQGKPRLPLVLEIVDALAQ